MGITRSDGYHLRVYEAAFWERIYCGKRYFNETGSNAIASTVVPVVRNMLVALTNNRFAESEGCAVGSKYGIISQLYWSGGERV